MLDEDVEQVILIRSVPGNEDAYRQAKGGGLCEVGHVKFLPTTAHQIKLSVDPFSSVGQNQKINFWTVRPDHFRYDASGCHLCPPRLQL